MSEICHLFTFVFLHLFIYCLFLLSYTLDFENVACEGAVGGENVRETDENEMLDRVVNRVKIKGGLDIDQLRRDGAIFEIDEDAVAVRLSRGGRKKCWSE